MNNVKKNKVVETKTLIGSSQYSLNYNDYDEQTAEAIRMVIIDMINSMNFSFQIQGTASTFETNLTPIASLMSAIDIRVKHIQVNQQLLSKRGEYYRNDWYNGDQIPITLSINTAGNAYVIDFIDFPNQEYEMFTVVSRHSEPKQIYKLALMKLMNIPCNARNLSKTLSNYLSNIKDQVQAELKTEQEDQFIDSVE